MKKTIRILLFSLACVCALWNYAFAASTTDTLANQYYFDLYSEIYPNMNRPYTAPKGEGTVDVTTGSVFTNVEDYRIRGKNGFDIPFIRSFRSNTSAGDLGCTDFSSENSVEHHYEMDFICAKDNKRVTIEFYNEMEIMKAGDYFEGLYYGTDVDEGKYYKSLSFSLIYDDKKTTSYTLVPGETPQKVNNYQKYVYTTNSIDTTQSFVKFDSTMKISKPALEMYDYLHGEGYWYVYLIFQDLQGETNAIVISYDTEESVKRYTGSSYVQGTYYSKYKMYAVDADDISVTATHPAGFIYDMYLIGDDGTKYYVKSQSTYIGYDILAAEDRYGNLYLLDINQFDFSVTTPDNVVYTCDKNGITMTSGEEVTELVRYTEEDVNNDTLDPDELYTADDEIVFTVTKNSCQENTISDSEDNVVTYHMYQDYRFNNLLRKWEELRYYLPYKIEFPSGLQKNFEYANSGRWHIGFGESAVSNGRVYSVSKYSESCGDDVRNKIEYTYTKEEYTQSNKPSKNYFSQVVQTLYDGTKVIKTITNTYDRYGKLLTSEIDGSTSPKYTYYYGYNGNLSLAKLSWVTEKQRYMLNDVSHTRNYKYLNNTYIKKEEHGDYKVNYTYYEDGNYIPHETTYMQDADTKIRIENILTDDKKGIATQNTYENDVLVKTVSYTYDSYGNVASETASIDGTNTIAKIYNYAYAPDGGYTLTVRITGVRDADGVMLSDIVTTSVYDYNYNLISQTDANGNTTTTTYDMLGRPLTVTHPDGTTESYAYDIANGITTYTAPNGTVYKAYFDAWGNKIKNIALVDGAEIQFDEYTYDDLGNMVTYKVFSSDTDFVRAEYIYDHLSRPKSEKIYDEDDTLIKTTTYTYSIAKDADSRPLNTVTATVTGDNRTYASVSQTANYRGFTTETKTSEEDNERVYIYTHDYIGNVLTATDPMGNVTSTAYNVFGKPTTVTYADGSSVSTEYNMLGLVASVTDARGSTTEYFYDNFGRNIRVETPIDGNRVGVTRYGYDGNGNVTSTDILTNTEYLQQEYRTVRTQYDSMNRPVSVSSAQNNTRYVYDEMGNVTNCIVYEAYSDNEDGIETIYKYDAFGRLVCTTTPDGLTETAEYDNLGRVTSSIDKAGRVTTFTYDSFNNLLSKSTDGESVSYTYNLLGLPTSMTDSTGTTTYTYNPFGELTRETKGSIIKSYTYDDLSRRTAFNVADGEDSLINQTYTYDAMGRLLSTASGEDTLSYTYDANSNLLTKAYNGSVYHTAQYNKANLPVVTQLYNGSEVADTTHYTYTPDGNLAMTIGTKVSSMYYYDNANRLIHENTWGDGIDYTDDYIYDYRGNRTRRIHQDNILDTSETTNYEYNDINQLLSYTCGTDLIRYAYDTVGNMTSVAKNGTTEKTYTYDAFNRLATATEDGVTSMYTYDGNNLRQSKTVNLVTTNHIYDGANIVADVNDTTTVFVRGMDLALLKNGNTTQVYGITPRGDVAKLMTPNGDATDFTYTAYGELTSANTSIYNPFGYTGEYTDVETGLVYLRNRYYDPEVGIFITIDPAKDGINWYAYCAGNPIAFVDPWGVIKEPANHEVYLREMFDMYRQSSTDTIAVYNNRVVVKLNDKQKAYYYDTKNKGTHGSRISEGKLIVDAVDFARHFDLVRSESNRGTEKIPFHFIDEYAVTTIITKITWDLSVSFVVTPKKIIVSSQDFYVSAENWTPSRNMIPEPVIQPETTIVMRQGNNTKEVSLKKLPQIVGTRPYYAKTQSSDKRIIFDRGSINSNIKVFISHPSSTERMVTKTIEQNFGYYK